MLSLHHITIASPQGRILIKDLDLTLNAHDRLAVIGEEGNGKSTLCRYIADPVLLEGAFIVTGQRLATGLSIGYLPQTFSSSELDQTLNQHLGLDSFDPDYPSSLAAMRKRLTQLGIQFPTQRFTERLGDCSGGERIKLTFAALLSKQPDLLVLDEPTNDLDLPTLRWLETFLLNTPLPVLFVSHDATLLSRCANRILHLEQTQRKQVPVWTLVSLGYEAYLQTREATLFRQTQLANKQKAQVTQQITRWRQIYQKVEHAQATVSRQDPSTARLLKKKIKNLKAVKDRLDETPKLKKPDPEEAITLFFDAREPLPASKRVLEDHLSVLERSGQRLSVDLHLALYGRDRVAIIGANGCGKTTYLSHLIDVAKAMGTRVGVMPQDYDAELNIMQTPVEALTLTGTSAETTRIMTLLGNLKFTETEMRQPLSMCSQGQKAKVLLTKLVMGEADLLVLDEPTRNLSPLTLPVIETMLNGFPGAILAVTHDRCFLRQVFQRVLELDEKGLVAVPEHAWSA